MLNVLWQERAVAIAASYQARALYPHLAASAERVYGHWENTRDAADDERWPRTRLLPTERRHDAGQGPTKAPRVADMTHATSFRRFTGCPPFWRASRGRLLVAGGQTEDARQVLSVSMGASGPCVGVDAMILAGNNLIQASKLTAVVLPPLMRTPTGSAARSVRQRACCACRIAASIPSSVLVT
jgi:hypothetical protein